MTDIIFRPRSPLLEESELPMWWKTIDKWSLFSLLGLFLCGLLLGMAASIPLAESNGKDVFYYVINTSESYKLLDSGHDSSLITRPFSWIIRTEKK